MTFNAALAAGLTPGESVVGNRVVAQIDGRRFVSERVETLVTVPFLRVEKSADVTVVEVGDFVEYRIRLHNTSAGTDTLLNILINDWTPPGFRYVEGDNTVRVTAQTGRGANQDSGPVTARVRVRPDLFTRGELILGRAWVDVDEDGMFDFDEEVVPGITLLMEDGTRVVADRHGKFSIPEVRPGDHVLRVLRNNLPQGLQPVAVGSRAAGDPWSRFVTVPISGSAKAKFPFRRTVPRADPEAEGP